MPKVADTSKISTLEIKEALFYDEYTKQSYPYLEFFVNGKSLYQSLCKIDKPPIAKIGVLCCNTKSNQYTPIHNATLDILLGNKTINELKDIYEFAPVRQGRYVLYECHDCGYLICGVISAEIIFNQDTVIWQKFGYEDENSLFLNSYQDVYFVFDRCQYESQLKQFFIQPNSLGESHE